MRAALALFGLSVSATAGAQPNGITFAAADARLDAATPALDAADHAVKAAREAAAATRTLNRPTVSASAQVIAYQKTLGVDLADARPDAFGAARDFLSTLPGAFPPAFQQIAGQVVGRIDQALPGLFAAIPDSLSYRYRDTVFRPTVQAAMPIYTGGAIPAIRRGARAGVTLAQGRAGQARDLARLNLVRVYFGQTAARALHASAGETCAALGSLYDDVARAERAGVLPRASTLEAAVVRDTAERALQRADLASRTAGRELDDAIDLGAAQATTPLFVSSAELPAVETFLGREADLAAVRQAGASREVAAAGVDLARARTLPQVFAFGEYNLNSGGALPTEPDWVAGVAARITLLSGIDRGRTIAAARETEAAAADAELAARKEARLAIRRAWDLVEGARRSFLLLDSSLAAAAENLRVQRVALREGEGTVTRVAGAEAALSAARAQRIATAYEYDLALAALLAASGRMDEFEDYLQRADIRVVSEPAR